MISSALLDAVIAYVVDNHIPILLQISYFLSPFALFLLVAIMGYGYSAVPNAGNALHSLFTANLRNVDDEFGAEPSVTEILKYRLGNPRVGIRVVLIYMYSNGHYFT